MKIALTIALMSAMAGQPVLPAPPTADAKIDTKFAQLAPTPPEGESVRRSPNQTHAVLLVHGLTPHVINGQKVFEARFHSWQRSDALLVKSLQQHADVYGFAYSQNVPLEQIHHDPTLASSVRKLQFLGYEDITLIGHSAGGLVARMFVEDYPRAGIDKVVQICTPNVGTSLAKFEIAVRKQQEPFLRSLTRQGRLEALEKRAGRSIPTHVEFVCLVGASGPLGDGLVPATSQWPADLQAQGIPAKRIATSHFTVMRSQKSAEVICELVRTHHPRWDGQRAQALRSAVLFGFE